MLVLLLLLCLEPAEEYAPLPAAEEQGRMDKGDKEEKRKIEREVERKRRDKVKPIKRNGVKSEGEKEREEKIEQEVRRELKSVTIKA